MASVLFLGASGQVGGALIKLFREKYPDIPITAFLRSTELDSALHNLGHTTIVHGNFDDVDTLESLAATHSIIIEAAASFQPSVSQALLRGIARTTTNLPTPRKPILLHLSGTGNFADYAETGAYAPQSDPFNDANESHVRRIDASYPPNGEADKVIFDATSSSSHIVNSFIVCPSGIYGHSRHHIAYPGPLGVWVKWYLDNAAALGFSPYVGPGTAEWRTVHVDDVIALTLLVFQRALDTWDTYQPQDVFKHYYIAVDERLTHKPIAEAFAEFAYKQGKIAKPVARSVAYEEAGKIKGYLGSNMLVRNENAVALGWKPQGLGFFETLKLMS